MNKLDRDDRTLLGKPETKIRSANADARKHGAQQDAEAERADEPNHQEDPDGFDVRGPIGVGR